MPSCWLQGLGTVLSTKLGHRRKQDYDPEPRTCQSSEFLFTRVKDQAD